MERHLQGDHDGRTASASLPAQPRFGERQADESELGGRVARHAVHAADGRPADRARLPQRVPRAGQRARVHRADAQHHLSISGKGRDSNRRGTITPGRAASGRDGR